MEQSWGGQGQFTAREGTLQGRTIEILHRAREAVLQHDLPGLVLFQLGLCALPSPFKYTQVIQPLDGDK